MKISLLEAVELLQKGEVIASSTDTVFGLLAKFDSPTAVEKIYALKGRPETKPLILLVPTVEEVKKFLSFLPAVGKKLMERFWPGPLTIVFPAEVSAVPSYIRSGGNTVAIRVPKHPLLSPLLSRTGPLVAPSLNKSGEKVVETVEEIEKIFGKELPLLYAEEVPSTTPSTLLEVTEQGFSLLREGAIDKELLEIYLPKIPIPL